MFHEQITNDILDDLVWALDPHYIKMTGLFNIRGGIAITGEAEKVKTSTAKEVVGN